MLELNNHVKMQSCLSERIWNLYENDPRAFNSAAVKYFEKSYPKYRIYSFDYSRRIVWLVERS